MVFLKGRPAHVRVKYICSYNLLIYSEDQSNQGSRIRNGFGE